MLAVASIAATAAHAAEPYAGINLTTPGETRARFGDREVGNDNHPHAVKLYAGLQFTPGWAGEIGYGAFGSWHIADPTPGSNYQLTRSSRLLYAASRATLPLGES